MVGLTMSSGMFVRWGILMIIAIASAASAAVVMVALASDGGGTGRLSMAGVSTSPGITTDDRMPVFFSSTLRYWVKLISPAFAGL